MTKFKVGDRVTWVGTVDRVYNDGFRVETESSSVYLTDTDEVRRAPDTTFRDQAAIAALQGLVTSGF